jgi:hypothetical protein
MARYDDLYRFSFGPNGEVLTIWEWDDGRWERERPDRDETYARHDGYVVKTEMDDGRLEWEAYADRGDGVWQQVGEGYGAFNSTLLSTGTTPVTSTSPVADHRFTISNGTVTGVQELDDGVWKTEVLEADESYAVTDQGVVKTEIGGNGVERTLYTDADGDGTFSETISWNQPIVGLFPEDLYHFAFSADGTLLAVYSEDRGTWTQEQPEVDETYALIDGLVIKTEGTEWTAYADSDGNGVWTEAVEGHGTVDLVAVKSLLAGMTAEGTIF